MNKIDWIVALSEKTEKVVKKIQNKTKCRLSKELKKIGTVAQFNTKTSVRGIRSLKVKKTNLKKSNLFIIGNQNHLHLFITIFSYVIKNILTLSTPGSQQLLLFSSSVELF